MGSDGPSQAQQEQQNELNQEMEQQKKQLALQRKSAQKKSLLSLAQSLGSESEFNDLTTGDDSDKGRLGNPWGWMAGMGTRVLNPNFNPKKGKLGK